MIHDVFMPALSSTMTEGKIVAWEKSPGDKVEKGETVVVVESDKADMDVESFYEGYLAVITVAAGESAPVGSPIALIAETEAEIEAAKQQATQVSQPAAATAQSTAAATPEPVAATTTVVEDTPSRRNGRIIVSPRARKLAKELKVDLNTLKGTGPNGRIVAEDVEAATGKTSTPAAPAIAPVVTTPTKAPSPAPVPPAVVPSPAIATGEVVALNTLQNAVVRNMVASMQMPTYRVGYTITTDELDKVYKQIKSKGVTMTALLAKAVAVTLQKHPLVNASYTEGGIQ
ncbi:MAG: 2-oxo acid dehydrogenase subunit E2, partial [Symploca sp. SIO1A3]|nr:2-oxo acid dehydrogenase subunit E2 [Symploca sp. SIO1A3]